MKGWCFISILWELKRIAMLRFLCIFLFLPVLLISQKHDHVWLFGYGANDPQDSLWGNSVMDFNYSPPKIYYDGYKNMDFETNNMSVSDAEGNFLFSGNGNRLMNHNNQSIEGEDFNIPFDFLELEFPGSSYFIPLEEKNQFGYLYSVHWFDDNSAFFGKDWWYALIDMNKNNGLGEVVSQQHILNDTLELAKISAIKHANGRDWWFLTKKRGSNQFFKILFERGKFDISEQAIGLPTIDGLGQACFSPDGTKYVNISAHSFGRGVRINLYDFNRCNGELSNHIQWIGDYPIIGGGVAFSPNSRFLYVTSGEKIYQYDTWETNLLASKVMVAEYDGFIDVVVTSPTTTFPVGTRFFLMQLAPDGKIYVNVTNGSYMLHVIENPNEKGLACNVKQHSIKLPTPNQTMPIFPNYRLGALEGSPCDTLVSSNSDIVLQNEIEVFPNPTNGNIQIEWASPLISEVSFSIFDISGKQVFEKTFIPQGHQESIVLGNLPQGIYFYQLSSEKQTLKTDKLVKID